MSEFTGCSDCGAVFEAPTRLDAQADLDLHNCPGEPPEK